jgi:hypothetical protein
MFVLDLKRDHGTLRFQTLGLFPNFTPLTTGTIHYEIVRLLIFELMSSV